MKKFLAILALFSFVLATPANALAQSRFLHEEVVTIAKNEVVNGNVFVTGEKIEILGTVNGDVYAAGGNILVDGEINGDLIAAGGNINVKGEVNQDVRLAGGQIGIDARVGGRITALSGNLSVGSETSALSLVTAAGNVDIAGTIEENVDAAVGNISLSNGAQVGGDLTYWSEDNARVSSEASVSGTIVKRLTPKFAKDNEAARQAMNGVAQGMNLYFSLSSLLTTFVIGFVFIRLFPNFTKRVTEQISKNFANSLLVGFLTVILAPAVILVLILTIIGIPLSIVLGFIFVLYLYIARIFGMAALGEKLLHLGKQKQNPYWAFTIGLVAYYMLSFIPFIGGLTKFVVMLVGIGAVIISNKNFYKGRQS